MTKAEKENLNNMVKYLFDNQTGQAPLITDPLPNYDLYIKFGYLFIFKPT